MLGERKAQKMMQSLNPQVMEAAFKPMLNAMKGMEEKIDRVISSQNQIIKAIQYLDDWNKWIHDPDRKPLTEPKWEDYDGETD